MVDNGKPECEITGQNTRWTSNDVTINYGAKDGLSKSYIVGTSPQVQKISKTVTSTTKNTNISQYKIKNEANIERTCNSQTVDVYVDKSAPIIDSSSVTEFSNATKFTIKTTDNESGIFKLEYYVNDIKYTETSLTATDASHNQFPTSKEATVTIDLTSVASATKYVIKAIVTNAVGKTTQTTKEVLPTTPQYDDHCVKYEITTCNTTTCNYVKKGNTQISGTISKSNIKDFNKQINVTSLKTVTIKDTCTNIACPATSGEIVKQEQGKYCDGHDYYGKTTTTTCSNKCTATLTYNNGGHGKAPSSVTMNYENATYAADEITVTGYLFNGWKRSDNNNIIAKKSLVKAANTKPNNLTLTATWKEKTATLTYTSNESGCVIPNPGLITMGYTSEIIADAPSVAIGYNFGGWRISDNNKVIKVGEVVKSDNVEPKLLT